MSGAIDVTDESLLIVDPYHLLNVTDILSYIYCPRKYYIEKVRGFSPYNKFMLRGSMVHHIFSELLKSPDASLIDLVDDVVYSNSLPIALLNLSEDYLRREVLQHSKRLGEYVKKNLSKNKFNTEKMVFSRDLGIKGRVDAVSDELEPLELKTKSCKNEDPFFTDKSQLILYNLMINKGNQVKSKGGRIIYSGNKDTLERKVEYSWGLANWLMKLRANIIAIDNDKLIPPFRGDVCLNCSDLQECMRICRQLDTSMDDCQKCSLKDLCLKSSQKNLSKYEKIYYKFFSKLIELEQKEGQKIITKILYLSPQQRAKKGTAIIDLKVKNIEKDGKNYSIHLSADNNSEIREGDLVLLSDGDPCNGENNTGIIEKIGKDDLIISAKEVPKKIGVVDLYESDLIFNRMKRSLYNFIFKKRDYLKKVVLGEADPRFEIKPDRRYIENDPSQNKAVNLALNALDLCLIQGPPGTGKTSIITRIVNELLLQNMKILICSYTNRAVDNVLIKLREEKIEKFLRIGNLHAINAELKDKVLNDFQSPKEVKKIIDETPIIATTSTYISSGNFEKLFFDVAIVDEASQMVEPSTLAVANLTKKLILIGDHKQLPAVVRSVEAVKKGFQTSMFERLINRFPHASKMLEYQYRMNQKIIQFSNIFFYNGEVQAANFQIGTQTLQNSNAILQGGLIPIKYPLIIYMVDGTCVQKINTREAEATLQILKDLTNRGVDSKEIGVITPYRAQVAEIRRLSTQTSPSRSYDIDTVDRFQGQERDVVIISLAESDPNSGIIFEDVRRFNVALTRAKKLCIILVNPNLRKNSLITSFLEVHQDAIFPFKS